MSESKGVESKVREIRLKTRRRYSAEEKIRIVLEGLKGEESIAALCRREGISPNLYYSWSKEFLEAGKRRLMGDTKRQASSSGGQNLPHPFAQTDPRRLILAGSRPGRNPGNGRPTLSLGSVTHEHPDQESHDQRGPPRSESGWRASRYRRRPRLGALLPKGLRFRRQPGTIRPR